MAFAIEDDVYFLCNIAHGAWGSSIPDMSGGACMNTPTTFQIMWSTQVLGIWCHVIDLTGFAAI